MILILWVYGHKKALETVLKRSSLYRTHNATHRGFKYDYRKTNCLTPQLMAWLKANQTLHWLAPTHRQWPINGVDDASPRPHWVNGERKVLRIDKRGASPSHSRKWESFWQLQSLFFAPFNSSFLHKRREKLNTCFPIHIPISIFISMNRHNQVVIKVNTQAQTLTHLYLRISVSAHLCAQSILVS